MENQSEKCLSGSLYEYKNQKSKSGKERFFSLEDNKLNCYRKKKEMIDKEPKYSLNIQKCKNIKLQKGKHDDILCIEYEEKTVFLIATHKEDINQWYDVLSRLCGNYEPTRERLYTEPTVTKRERDFTTRQVTTSPGSLDNFMNKTIENEAQRRSLPALPEDQTDIAHTSEANANNINIHVLNDLPCCIRHHIVQHHEDGRNMVDTETLYENIHFIRNIEEWHQQAERKKHNLQVNKECYNLANTINGLQEHSETHFEGKGDIGQLSQSNNEEPIYMNTPKPPSNIKPRIPAEDEFPRPVPGDNNTPIPRKVVTTQPPPPALRPPMPEKGNGGNRPTKAPKPATKPRKEKPSDDPCSLQSCPGTTFRARDSDDYVRPENRNGKGPTTAPKPAPKLRKEETSDNPCPLRSCVCPDTNCLARNSDEYVRPPVPEKGNDGKRPTKAPKPATKPRKEKPSDDPCSLQSCPGTTFRARDSDDYVRLENRNGKGPTTAPKPAPKLRKEETSDNPCPLRSFVCPDTNRRARNSDEYVSKLVRQQGKGSEMVNIPKQVLTKNKIKLAEINNGIWFGGFEHNCPENSKSHWLLFGDQLVQINDQWLNSAEFAGNIIETTCRQEVSLCVKRLPHAQIITIHREYEHQLLGFECHRREITKVIPDEIASTQVRLRPEATGILGMNCTWTITHINSDPISSNITTEMMEEKLKMAGNTVHLIVQPTDFVQEINHACCKAHSC